jgi:hypothetical protein
MCKARQDGDLKLMGGVLQNGHKILVGNAEVEEEVSPSMLIIPNPPTPSPESAERTRSEAILVAVRPIVDPNSRSSSGIDAVLPVEEID